MAEKDDEAQDDGLYIDGEFYGEEDLTYGEQRAVRQLVKEANAEDESFDVNDAALIDLIPAIVKVIKNRTDPDFSWNDALALKPSDLRAPKSDPTEEG